MWNPKYLRIQNFRSFEDQEFDFKQGAYLIQGINKTDAGQEKNGAGKSAFRESINYALGLPVYVDRVIDLIRNGQGSCKVIFILENKGTEFYIERESLLKGDPNLVIKLNSEDQKDKFSTIPEGNKLIIELLGISKEDLLNHYIISSEKYTSIFSSSDSKVKELIGRFSNFNKIDGVEDIVKGDVGELNQELLKLQSEKDRLSGKLEILNEQLESEKLIKSDDIRDKMIEEFQEAISMHESKIYEENKLISVNKDKIVELKETLKEELENKESIQVKLDSFEGVNFDKDIEETNKIKESCVVKKEGVNKLMQELNKSLRGFTNFKTEVELSISGAIKCPKCLHEFVVGEEIDVEEAKKTLPGIKEEIDTINDKLNNYAQDISVIDSDIFGLNKKLDNFEASIDKARREKSGYKIALDKFDESIRRINSFISGCNQNIEDCNKKIERYKDLIEEEKQAIEETKTKTFENREKEINKQIEEVNILVNEKDESIELLKNNIFDKEQWVHRFKKFRTYLANESLEIIQGYSNMYLEKMGSDLNLQLEGYKQNADGSIREKITPIVLRNGERQGSGSFKKYSKGERTRIDVCTSILALQNLINNSCLSGGLNLLIIDEVLEGVDSLGLESLVKELDKLQKFCYVISHTTHQSVPENVLTIEKVNGISKIL